jgi:hypothetical protein
MAAAEGRTRRSAARADSRISNFAAAIVVVSELW